MLISNDINRHAQPSLVGGLGHCLMDYPANTLSPLDLQAKALTELNETEDCRRQGLAFLRDAIAEPKYDGLFAYHEARRDLFLLAFLRWRKFDCRRALRSLVRFSRFRTAHPAFFTGNVHNLALFMDHGMIRILPKRTPQGVPPDFRSVHGY